MFPVFVLRGRWICVGPNNDMPLRMTFLSP